MSWRDHALELLGPLYKPRIDPGRARRVYRGYDEELGFAAYGELCRRAFLRGGNIGPAGSLERSGFTHLDVLAPEHARELLERVKSSVAEDVITKGRHPLDGFRIEVAQLREQLLTAVLGPAMVDGHLIGYFQSEYLVLWMTLTATPPASQQSSVSFLWHCDKGPRTHLKLIVYLNATEEHGGNTEFVSLDDTAAVAARGYLFGRVRHRTGEVAHLAALAGRPISTHLASIPAGGGVLFQPACVLHRGVMPSLGTRYALTLCLLPSPVPWRQALARGTLCDLAVDDKWPRHASELSSALLPGGRLGGESF